MFTSLRYLPPEDPHTSSYKPPKYVPLENQERADPIQHTSVALNHSTEIEAKSPFPSSGSKEQPIHQSNLSEPRRSIPLSSPSCPPSFFSPSDSPNSSSCYVNANETLGVSPTAFSVSPPWTTPSSSSHDYELQFTHTRDTSGALLDTPLGTPPLVLGTTPSCP